MKIVKILLWGLGCLAGLVLLLAGFVYAITFHPASVQSEPVSCSAQAPLLQAGQKLKVLTWNVQYMTGKNYVFWYDLPDGNGPDERPSSSDITQTINTVAGVIRSENPDIILLEEVDVGAARTDYEDQLSRLQGLLPPDYACSARSYYWKALYVPHARIHGAVGMQLAVVSKYQISKATRYQLALAEANLLTRQFNTKRAVLETRLPLAGGGELAALVTHLEAFAQGSNVMDVQVKQVGEILQGEKVPWVLGGDFNLLPPVDSAYDRLPPATQVFYNRRSEIAPLYTAYQPVPSLEEVSGPDYASWFSHFPNGTGMSGPFLNIDYLFFPKSTRIGAHYIRQSDTLKISDHLPVVAEFTVEGP
jgi:endonuclease/exonuclease/phosphatase family metal-dependent hydrolase